MLTPPTTYVHVYASCLLSIYAGCHANPPRGVQYASHVVNSMYNAVDSVCVCACVRVCVCVRDGHLCQL